MPAPRYNKAAIAMGCILPSAHLLNAGEIPNRKADMRHQIRGWLYKIMVGQVDVLMLHLKHLCYGTNNAFQKGYHNLNPF